MSLFAGTYFLGSGPGPGDPSLRILELLAARFGSQGRFFRDGDLALACADLGAFPTVGIRESRAGLFALAGDLIIRNGSERTGRPWELDSLAVCAPGDLPKLLVDANGTFALAHYDRASRTLTLAADSLGGRPIYFYRGRNVLYFSTSLKFLLEFPEVPRQASLPAFIEEEIFCYPLGDRTLFADIAVLRDSEMLIASGERVHLERYFHWEDLALSRKDEAGQIDDCYAAFIAALDDRSQGQSTCRSLLSGGLDSRCVAAGLLSLGQGVEARTVHMPGYQDFEYASRFASKAGIALDPRPFKLDENCTSSGTTSATMLGTMVDGWAPGTVFSGDGGGETFGFLMIEPGLLEDCDGESREDLTTRFLEKSYVATRSLKSHLRDSLERHPKYAMVRELEQLRGLPIEKALHQFALRNDQRRHLHEYFEHIDRFKVELLLPFYDKRVLASVLSIPPPLEPYLGHRFYGKLIERFGDTFLAAPWQTYDNRVPCPIADPDPPRRQWELDHRTKSSFSSLWLKMALSLTMGPGFPDEVLRRWPVFAGAALHLAGRHDYSYLFMRCINLSRLKGASQKFTTVLSAPRDLEVR